MTGRRISSVEDLGCNELGDAYRQRVPWRPWLLLPKRRMFLALGRPFPLGSPPRLTPRTKREQSSPITAIINLMYERSLLTRDAGRLRMVAVLALAAMLTPSCGSSDSDAPSPEPPQEIRITVTDESFGVPDGLESEPVSLTLQNDGKQVHRAFFARLNQGVTEEDVRSALSKGPDALFPLLTLAGNMPEAKAGATSEIGMLFPEGDYIVIDPEVKGPPPLQFFEVSAASGAEVEEPAADSSVETGDFYFEISDPSSGEAIVEITNVGEQSHEVGIGRGANGEGEEVTTIFAPAPGGKMWASVTLQPGDYTLVCFLPDPKTGKPHVKLGMKKHFTVK
jgi:hypothetical protein